MKKILFLSFSYPYGHFGPSDNCTVRVMEALASTGRYEVWNLSYKPESEDSKPNYKLVEGVNLLYLPFPEKRTHHSYIIEHLLLFLKIPIYPFYHPNSIWRHYSASKSILSGKDFDLIVSQCAPQESVMTSTLLRKNGFISKSMVLFWDNIYGKFPRRVIPRKFALYRSRKVENWIAKYSDRLISPSPFRVFHEQFGEVKEGIGKRVYLEHPSVIPPQAIDSPSVDKYIIPDRINILYAGRVYFKEHLAFCLDLLGRTTVSEKMNFILLTKGISEEELNEMAKSFKGNITHSGWIPTEELNALYHKTDICIAFSGFSPSSVASKVYEYMCYGNPLIYFYEEDNDVTRLAVSPYPISLSISLKSDLKMLEDKVDRFIRESRGKRVPYEQVEGLFPDATGRAYVRVIDNLVG